MYRIGLLLALLLGFVSAAGAQPTYPQRSVRFIVPFPAGGSADALCRLAGERMSSAWNQTVVVENRAGAGGNIGADVAFRAEPDGYTLLCTPPGPLAINQNLYGSLSFDPQKFIPITILAIIPNVISARLDLPANNVAELIAYAKANPGKVFYASQGNGSTSHLSAQMFATMAGIELVHVPYKGEGPALIDLIAGRIDIFIGNIAGAARFETTKQLKFLALASATRSPIAPHVPSAPEIGMPDFIASAWMALAAPPGTPQAVIEAVNAAARDALKEPELRRRFLDQGAEPVGDSAAATAQFIKSEERRWREVIRTGNVKLD